MDVEVFIGWDPRERLAWNVCARSLAGRAAVPPPIRPIGMATLGGAYTRPTARTTVQGKTRLIDEISGHPMATEFALARFWVPLVSRASWALFCDADMLWRADVGELLAQADRQYAVQVVKHRHVPRETEKMDGQLQSTYERKNWSSLVLWNLRHAGSRRLWPEHLNKNTGLWLHQFSWLKPAEIGELDPKWNALDSGDISVADPHVWHFTRGTPDMIAEDLRFAQEWWGWLTPAEVARWESQRGAACGPENFASA